MFLSPFPLFLVFPFFSSFLTMATQKTSLATQNFATETADAINQQIQVEQQAQHTYLACAAYFGRDDVALPVRFTNLYICRVRSRFPDHVILSFSCRVCKSTF